MKILSLKLKDYSLKLKIYSLKLKICSFKLIIYSLRLNKIILKHIFCYVKLKFINFNPHKTNELCFQHTLI